MPIRDYQRLVDLVEDKADALAAAAAARRRAEDEEHLPADMVDRLLAGENPLQTWRKHRGLTLDSLARTVGTSSSTLADIENGKTQGQPALWRALANALSVTVDDLLPES